MLTVTLLALAEFLVYCALCMLVGRALCIAMFYRANRRWLAQRMARKMREGC